MLYHSLAESIHELEKYAAGVKLIERMRNSIRQRRYRLAEGGRKTCSFTLPLNTKDKLKILAKNADTTETAIIESLIAGALQSSQDQKEGKRREALEKTITRNSSKLAQELNKIRLEVTTKHLDASLRRLAGRYTSTNRPPNFRLSRSQKLTGLPRSECARSRRQSGPS
ncbi:hypothetical protein QJS63_23795 [Pseudomonas juntendi]|nr:hypothetical protein QJS63_23795 [Pseudomonas juntendi]